MSDLSLQGSKGLFMPSTQVNYRQAHEGVNLEQIKKATDNNNLDEVIVEDQQGKKYIAYADELSVKNGALPKVGDKVNLAFIEGEAQVLHVDNEIDEDLGTALMEGFLPFLGEKIAQKYGDKGAYRGDASEIQKMSSPLERPTEQEMKWALELAKKVTQDNYQPSPSEMKTYEGIYIKHL